MSETRLRLNLSVVRSGKESEAIKMYYVLGHKPAGSVVARVIIEEDLDLRANDALIFDFTGKVE